MSNPLTTNAPPQHPAPLPQVRPLHEAIALHQAGRLEEAVELYRAILLADPHNAEANYNMGILAMQINHPAAGLPYFSAALDADPTRARYWLSYIDALFQADQLDDARQILALAQQHGLQGAGVDALAARLEISDSIATPAPPIKPQATHAKQAKERRSAATVGRATNTTPTEHEVLALTTLFGQGRYAETESLALAMTRTYPAAGFGWLVLGAARKQAGRCVEALEPAQKAVALLPNDANANSNLGSILKELGRYAEAEASLRRALAIQPDHTQALSNLGATLLDLGRLTEAETALRNALEIDPNNIDALNNLGNMLMGLRRYDEAVTCYRKTLQINPRFAEAHNNLGATFQELNRLEDAAACYRHALEINPNDVKAHNNLGVTLEKRGLLEEAEACYRRALAINPDLADTHINLGSTLIRQSRLHEAEQYCQNAVRLAPFNAHARSNLGVVLQNLGQHHAAEECYRRALQLQPDFVGAMHNLLFNLNYDPDKSAGEIFAAYREYDARFALPLRDQWHAHGNRRDVNKRLKVGYVSPDFWRHSSRHFVEPLLAQHDKNAVEVFAYAEMVHDDAVTARYKTYVDHWIPTNGLSDAQLTERIRADGIDILVDLAGHTQGNRLGVFARKPAPVSLTWMGYGNTTGLSAIDYFLTDDTGAPADSDPLFAEQPWRIANPDIAFRPAEDMGEVSALPALRNGYVTFCTLTRRIRINHRTVRVWSEILQRVADARLVINSNDFRDPVAQQLLAGEFAAHGVARERLLIGCQSPPWDVLRSVDIALDCFPHTSGTTLLETLYMGVPYVTLAGRPRVGRIGSSMLRGAGHPEWIAATEDAYIEKAVALASNLPVLTNIRALLRHDLQVSPLMDEAGFARRVEAAYREMFQRWAHSESNAAHSIEQKLHEAIARHTAGDLQAAGELYRAILDAEPQHAKANHNFGTLAVQMQQPAAGLPFLETALDAEPSCAQFWISYIDALIQTGQNDEAQRVLTLARTQGLDGAEVTALSERLSTPASPPATTPQLDRVNTHEIDALMELYTSGKFSDVVTQARAWTERFPQFAEGWMLLGMALNRLGNSADALQPLRKAAELAPNNAEVHNNLGNTLHRLGQREAAVEFLRAAVRINPEYADAHFNLGNTLMNLRRLVEAESCYRRALQIKPDNPLAHNNLGILLQDLGRHAEAEASYRRALELKPDFGIAMDNLLFFLNYDPDKSAEEIFAAYRDYDARFAQPLRAEWQPHVNNRNLRRRLKVGYVSTALSNYSSRHFVEPLLSHHDKRAFEVYAYADVFQDDAMTARYRAYVDHWVLTNDLTDAQLAERIRADGIDILVDLVGHVNRNRLGVFARKPAPVSLTWLGYGGTTGLSAIDYLLTDDTAAPPGSDAVFSEKPWRIATPDLAFRPAEDIGAVSALPALTNGYVTFCTLTRRIRINHHTIRVWSEILQRVANARLIVNSHDFSDPAAQKSLADAFAAHGIAPERLVIGFQTPPWDTLRSTDIGLDCFPHNSGTTLLETLYMGVPYITLAGRPRVGRIGSSMLRGAGHPEWIANTENEYIEKAVALASNLPVLTTIRARLRHDLQVSPIMDEPGLVRRVEAAYRKMFQEWARAIPSAAANDAPRHRASTADEIRALVGMATSGDFGGAEIRARAMLASDPRQPMTWMTLGMALDNLGRSAEALEPMRKAIELAPRNADAHLNLGVILKNLNQLEAARNSYEKALQINPNIAEAHFNLGNMLRSANRLDEAAASYRKALRLEPKLAAAHFNLGTVQKARGLFAEAEASYQHALEIIPDDEEILTVLAGVQTELGRTDAAEANYRRALKLRPELVEAHNNLANLLFRSGRQTEAEACLRQAIQIKPDYAEAYYNLGNILMDLSRLAEAKTCFVHALKIDPTYLAAQQNLVTLLAYLSEFDEVVAASDVALKLDPTAKISWEQRLYTFSYHPDLTAPQIFAEFERWGNRYPVPPTDFSAHDKTPGRRLRIGFVSPDFRKHTSRFYFWPMFAHHDHAVVEMFAYSNVLLEDEATAKFKTVFDHWRNIRGVTAQDVARMIRADRIDILVDGCNHMLDDRLDVFALKPAPIQATWLGAAWTTGLKQIDYVLFDPYIAPQGTLSSETILRLPRCFIPYQPENTTPTAPTPALKNGYITFGYSGRTERLNHHTFRVWGEILRRVPNSRLILDFRSFADPATQEHYRQFMRKHGMDPKRVSMRRSTDIFSGLNDFDVLLDSFPHSAGTMALDGLWLSVPMLTLAGRPPLGRIGTSFMTQLGMTDWIAYSHDEYIEKAVEFTKDVHALNAVRATVRARMQASAIMDGQGFAREIESAYQTMYATWIGTGAKTTGGH